MRGLLDDFPRERDGDRVQRSSVSWGGLCHEVPEPVDALTPSGELREAFRLSAKRFFLFLVLYLRILIGNGELASSGRRAKEGCAEW